MAITATARPHPPQRRLFAAGQSINDVGSCDAPWRYPAICAIYGVKTTAQNSLAHLLYLLCYI